MPPLGPLSAFGASVTWAYASGRYTRASREVGSVRVNQMRALVAFPVFTAAGLVLHGPHLYGGMTWSTVGWLVASIIGSYVLGDSVFLTAARRAGITTALSIASTYPLWAALFGVVVEGEPFGLQRSLGTCLAVAGVVWLVRLSGAGREAHRTGPRAMDGFALAIATSLFWAMNSICVKKGSAGFDPTQVNSLRFGVAIVLLTLQRLRPSLRALPGSPSGGWSKVAPALVADTLLGSFLYVHGLSHSDLAVGATLSSLAPLVSVPLSIAAGEETWSPHRLAAVITTVSGVVILVTAGAG